MFQEIDHYYSKLKKLRPLSSESMRRLSEDFMIEYTYDSNAIEGNALTLDETSVVIKEGITIAQKPLKDHLEAIGHRDAYYFVEGLVKTQIPLSEKTIKEIHTLVLIDSPEQRGTYRSLPVRVGSFLPCQPYLVPVEMEKLLADYNGEMQSLHVIERAALFHLRFETIHPFLDGNGRTGRLLLNFDLMQEGYPPINIKFSDRAKYYECFKHYQKHGGDTSEMVGLVAAYAKQELERYISITEESQRIETIQASETMP